MNMIDKIQINVPCEVLIDTPQNSQLTYHFFVAKDPITLSSMECKVQQCIQYLAECPLYCSMHGPDSLSVPDLKKRFIKRVESLYKELSRSEKINLALTRIDKIQINVPCKVLIVTPKESPLTYHFFVAKDPLTLSSMESKVQHCIQYSAECPLYCSMHGPDSLSVPDLKQRFIKRVESLYKELSCWEKINLAITHFDSSRVSRLC